jgi:hypothetical protein
VSYCYFPSSMVATAANTTRIRIRIRIWVLCRPAAAKSLGCVRSADVFEGLCCMACLSSFAVPHEPGSSRCPTLSHDATTRFFARAIKSRNYNCNYIGKFGLYAWCGPEVSAYVSWSALSDPARALSRLFQKSFWKFAQKKIRFQKAIFLIFGKKIFSFREFGSCRLEFRARDPTIPEFSKTESHSTSTPSVRVRRLDCPGECLLVMVKLACGSTEAKGRL